jgi:hypothetical protein
MATRGKKPEPGVVERLSKRGEEAFTRLAEELGRNERLADALGKAMSAKGRLDGASRRALGQVGLAAADELRELRAQIEKLEKRLAKLEGASTPAKRRETKTTSTARKKTRTRAKRDQDKAPSPPPGRALGGGSGRGSSAG